MRVIPVTLFLIVPALLLAFPGIGMTFGGPFTAIRMVLTTEDPTRYWLFWDAVLAFPVGVALLTVSVTLLGLSRAVLQSKWKQAGYLTIFLLIFVGVSTLVATVVGYVVQNSI
mgnify:CR=1 FL=1